MSITRKLFLSFRPNALNGTNERIKAVQIFKENCTDPKKETKRGIF
jgi:hypothetical protein